MTLAAYFHFQVVASSVRFIRRSGDADVVWFVCRVRLIDPHASPHLPDALRHWLVPFSGNAWIPATVHHSPAPRTLSQVIEHHRQAQTRRPRGMSLGFLVQSPLGHIAITLDLRIQLSGRSREASMQRIFAGQGRGGSSRVQISEQ